MSWTTVCDLSFTHYQPNLVLDASDFHNDAQVKGSTAVHPKFATFQKPDDRLVVPVKDDSLQRFTGLRVEAVINPTPSPHRLNIVEGWMSFAFFVESDQRLWATIYDGHNWVEVTSGTTLVPMNQWSRVSFEYDGICLGRLSLNGVRVGSRLDMPLGMHQPQQNITIGHWPDGDGRYTFVGQIGHVRIDRRDYEDFWRSAANLLLCRRRLNPRQAEAMRELMVLSNSLNPKVKEQIHACAKARSEELIKLLRELRAGNMRAITRHRQLAHLLREIWCCRFEATRAKLIFSDFIRGEAGPPGSEQRNQFTKTVERFMKIGSRCASAEPPFDRMRELLMIIAPELSFLQGEIEQLIQRV